MGNVLGMITVIMCDIPKGIEDACRRQASEAPEHRVTM